MELSRSPTHRRVFPVLVVLAACVGGMLLPGCVRVLALGTKVFYGDPQTTSTFEQRTQVELQSGEHKVAVVIEAPHQVMDEFDGLVFDVRTELVHQLRRHGVQVIDPSEVTHAIEDAGGAFSPRQLARAIDVDYIMQIEIRSFTDTESGNSSMLQCRASGMVTGYEVRGEPDASERHIVERYEEPFLVNYPKGHPLLAEQTTRRAFLHDCATEVARSIGRQMYDVRTSELY